MSTGAPIRSAPCRLAELLRVYRALKDKDLRTLAEEIGVSAPTLMRIEHGRSPDAETFMKLLIWLVSR